MHSGTIIITINKKSSDRMIDLFQDRKIFLNSKRRHHTKNVLPEIKYSPNIMRKMNDDIIFLNDNSKMLTNYQPLSNILVSKKIRPPNPEQATIIISKKKPIMSNIHNFKIRKQSVKKMVEKEQQFKEQEKDEKRNTTSLSYRPINREDNNETFEEPSPTNKINYRSDELTFAIAKANNNEDLVRSILVDRKIWKQVKFGEVIPNLKWVFFKDRHNYKKMWSYTQKRVINHFEFNEQISTKDSLVKNLQIYCETKKIEIFTITPVTFILDFDDQYCQYNMKQFINFFQKNDPRKNLPKRGNQCYNFVNKFSPYMGWQNSDIKKKVNILSRPVNSSTYYSENSYLWLLKPTGLNRGRGIQIFDSVEELERLLEEYLQIMNRKVKKDKEKQKDKQKVSITKDISPTKEISSTKELEIESATTDPKQSRLFTQKIKLNACSFVIQKYVQKPLLIQNRKFDIRVWALLTQSLNLYFFKEGYIRTSAENYSTDNISNYFIHLTNNAIQKHSQNYGQFQNGNQLSFKALKEYIGQDHTNKIWEKIKQISYMTFNSVKKKMNSNQRKHCFQLFGLDFFIDSELKVWLIEVNENPCIECSSPLLGELIPRMISDSFKLTIDLLYEKRPEDKPYPVKGYKDNQNMWQNLGQLTPNGEYSASKK